ncbi:MAG TPA: FAD-dependent oxidoreductase [Edaphobacter sp.]|jgi:glycine/D-amino acid oxidase-like deaminating enzyme|nr:FAD-dependent oxidoreductase [Edaphobacter sp.]
MKSYDVLIVGAGIVGCACAFECAQADLRVGLIERGVTGGGATAAGMGHIVVMDDSPAQLDLTRYSRSLWQQLVPKLPDTVEYETRGTLWVAANEEEMTEVHSKRSTYAAVGVAADVLNQAEVAAEEPKLRPGLAGGLLVPDDGVIYPPAAAEWLLDQAVTLGATLLQGIAVSAGDGELRLADGTILHSDRIVLATGADNSLMPTLPIKKRKGHLLITDRYPGFLRHQLVELGYLKSAHTIETDSVAFNIQPRRTGQLLIGSSRQYGDEDSRSDAGILTQMLERATSYMPELACISGLRIWTGFRAATPDKLPLIGPAQGLSDDHTLWVAAGFEGLGITNALGAARLLSDQMLGRESEIDPAPYLPQRMSTQADAHA